MFGSGAGLFSPGSPGFVKNDFGLYGLWAPAGGAASTSAPSSVLDANRTPSPQPSTHRTSQTLDDLLYGQVIPISGGLRLIRGRALWWTPPRTITVPNLVSAADGSPNGGQLISTGTAAGSTATVMDIAVSFGAPLASSGKRDILQIKAGVNNASTIIYDMTATPPVNAVGLNFVFYPGSETQLPDPTIEAVKGAGLTQAYRGQMYAVFKDFPIDLFVEGGNPVMPLFAALISDDSLSTVTTETFSITTGTTVHSPAAIDWTGGIVYWNGYTTAYRLMASQLWGNHTELFDLPVVNLSAAHTSLNKQMFFIDGLGLLMTLGHGTIHPNVVLIDPATGRIVAECVTITGIIDLAGNFTWSIDTTGATPVYVFALLTAALGILEVFSYDPATNVFASLGHSANYLDGNAAAVSLSVGTIARGTNESGKAVFYIGSSANVHKVVVDLDNLAAPYTFTAIHAPASAVNLLHFLPQENALVAFLSSGTATKLRCTDSAVLWSASSGFTVDPANPGLNPQIVNTDGWRRTRPFFGYINRTVAPTGFWLLDLSDGTAAFTAHSFTTLAYELTFDSETKNYILSDYSTGPNPEIYSLGAAGSGSYAFSDLVLALATLCGYADGDVTVSGIDDEFAGVIIDSEKGYVDFLNENRELLNFEIVEDDTIRVFRIPDNPSIDFTITPDMCTDSKDGPVTLRQEQESSFASALEIRYRDAALDYAEGSQIVKRPLSPVPTTSSQRADSLTSDLIMTADQAAELGTPVIYRRAAGGTKLTLVGLPLLAEASPGDVVLVESGANNYTAKIKQTALSGSLSNQITAQVIQTETAFNRLGSSGDTLPFSYTVPNPASQAILLDGPLLGYRDDLGGLGLSFRWVATSRGQDNWSGAQFFYGFDNINFAAASGTAVTAQTVHVGIATAALPDNPAPFMTDYTNTITVTPTSGDFGTLASVTYDEMMDGDTLAYIGRPGRWEVIGWQTIAANANGTYTFAGLLRGLYGTEVFSGEHLAGDLFVPISGNDIRRGAFATSTLDDVLYYRGVGIGQKVLSALPEVSSVSGNAERPPAPAHLDAVVSGSDIDLSCIRRSRFAVHLTDWAVIESESADGWEFDILDSGDVVRTITSTTEGATYLAADITTDFGSLPASLNFRAYRIGHDGGFSVGRGFAAEATIAL